MADRIIDCIYVSAQSKICNGCGAAKPLVEFGKRSGSRTGPRARCKPCEAVATRDYRERNPEHASEYGKRYREEKGDLTREKARKYAALLRASDPESARSAKRAWSATEKGRASKRAWREANRDRERVHDAKRRSTPKGRLENSIRVQVFRTTIRGSKEGRRTFELLGYNVEKLREHLERQFKPRMSWKNHGKWHIDHIIPLSSFSYETPDDSDFSAAWALTNLRPIWAAENQAKSNHRTLLI